MADQTFTMPSIKLPDGSTLTMSGTIHPATVTPVVPPAGPVPTLITIGDRSHVIDAVNPTSTTYPGGRGPDQLVLYRAPITRTVTNPYGLEFAVSGSGVVLCAPTAGPTTIPANGYAFSAHGTSAAWVETITVGATVTLSVGTVPPVVTPPVIVPPVIVPPVGTYPAREIAVYKMMWSTNGPKLSDLHPANNVVRLAFGQGDPLSLVGWGDQGQASFRTDATAMRTRGVRFALSVGGQGGAVNTANLTNFITGVRSVKTALGFLDALDWDIEASAMNSGQIRAIENALVAEHGPNFGFSYAPNGSNVGQYLPCAVACQKAGQLLSYGQQFYDSTVSVSAAAGRISEAVRAGIPIGKISVGMMNPPGSVSGGYWDNPTCQANMVALRAQFPGLQRVFYWEGDRVGASQWAANMSTILG